MNTSRSKMLVRLSKQNIKHYNNTDSVTVVSNVINDCIEKENRNRNNHNEYENYLQDDLGSRNFISPIIPLSESQLNECISEELGERVYAQLVPALICDKNLDVSNISTEDFHQFRIFMTLGYTNDEAVQSVLKNNYLESNKNPKISATPDLRGRRYAPSNKFPPEYEKRLEEFIMKYNPVPSHYNISHAPNRKYLPIAGLPQDMCTKCKNHKIAYEILFLYCEECKMIGQHLENKRNSRRYLSLAEDRSNNSEGKEAMFTVDMQKAICMPLLRTKDYYFSRKLVLFNESFVPPGKNKNAVCILWHEGESGRKAYNIATTYVHFIRKYCRDLHHLNFFLDNCNAQNKNKILFSALVRVVNDRKTDIQTLKLEYFEPGHTFMAADAVHAAITKKLKTSGDVYDIEFSLQISRSQEKTLMSTCSSTKIWYFLRMTVKLTLPKDWNIQNLKIIEFRRGKLSMFAKNDYNGEFKELNILKKKVERDLRKKMGEEIL
ncbi:unnamed protein product [Parnassius apollo]|uniref:(apollo) hypothetical protein n=1 Tax=Parnassius apollo TaxID=110799 RepID=A0A8S3Y1Q9_PARAO|nr:unnamed protein product [Parnassius apollo]